MKPKCIVILGQTATGKSDLAVYLAQQFDGEVISADSRQVYRGMDIGSGKITKEEMQGIPHHLLDIKTPDQDFSAEEFQRLCLQAMEDITKRGKISIICGGTGFYIQSIVENIVFQKIPKNQKLRDELEEKSITELQTILAKIPKEDGVKTDTDNKRRLIRAIEIGTYFGKLFCIEKSESEYEFLQIGLTLPKEILHNKIEKRLRERLAQGMIQEVEALLTSGLSHKKLESFGLEYKYCSLYIQGKLSEEEFFETLLTKIKQYAKRQNTWFQRDENIHWFSPDERNRIINLVKEYLQK